MVSLVMLNVFGRICILLPQVISTVVYINKIKLLEKGEKSTLKKKKILFSCLADKNLIS